MVEIHQKALFEKRSIYLLEDNVLYYMNLSFAFFSIVGFLYNLIIGVSVGYVGFWMVVSLILGTIYFATRKRYTLIDLTDGKSIFILSQKPNQEAVQNFIRELMKNRNEYLREHYFYTDKKNEKGKEITRLSWLRDEKVITTDEYDSAVEELNSLF